MSQNVPWSVKGVDPESRETAKDLARRSGMTLGQWLRTMIAEQEEEPAPPLFPRQNLESPLAAIVRRLDAKKVSEGPLAYNGMRREVAGGGVSAAVLARHIRASEARVADLVNRLMHRQEENEARIAALVDAIVDGFAVSGRTDDAPARYEPARVEPVDAAAQGAIVEDTIARDLERRLAAMGARLDQAPPKPEFGPLPTDQLSAEIAALTREITELRRGNTVHPAEGTSLADLRADIAALGRSFGQQIAGLMPSGQFAGIDKKLDLLARQTQDPTILAAIQRETADIRERLGDLIRLPDPAHRLEQKIDALQSSFENGQATTSAALARLMVQLDAFENGQGDAAALSGLEQQVAAMAKGVEALKDLRPDFSGLEPALGAALGRSLATSPLQGLPEELRRLFAELRGFQDTEIRGTKKTLEALQAVLHQLAGRLTEVEGLVRSRTIGTIISGPPEIGDVPPLFGRDRPDDIIWSRELPRSLAGDAPTQTEEGDGSAFGRPSQVSALGQTSIPGQSSVGSEARNSFIAAARRATRAAAEADGSLAREASKPGEGENEPFYQRHKRPILLGLAAITMMMGALQGGRALGVSSAARTVARAAPSVAPAPGVTPPRSPVQVAEKGGALSFYEEALHLDTADASTQDLARAAGLYRQAAMLGHGPALFRLGLAYDRGRGVGHDAVLAGLWYQRAAERGSVKAMHNLAVLYAGGAVMGVPDFEQTARWFRQAADHGHAASQYNYALLVAQGLGVPRDLATAYRFLALAAGQGDPDAAAKRDEVAGRLAPGERAAIDAAVRGA